MPICLFHLKRYVLFRGVYLFLVLSLFGYTFPLSVFIMSESTASADYEDLLMSDDLPVKFNIHKRTSTMDEADVLAMVESFKIPKE